MEEAERMSKKQHTPEQIVKKLREAEVLLARGMTVPQAARGTCPPIFGPVEM
jgi:hypothetical protein